MVQVLSSQYLEYLMVVINKGMKHYTCSVKITTRTRGGVLRCFASYVKKGVQRGESKYKAVHSEPVAVLNTNSKHLISPT